jgi:hypothetical protein
MIMGSCLCGGIKFEINEENIFMMNNCYCVNCRKVSGADCVTAIQVSKEEFNWLTGEDLITTFESSPGNQRAFCRVCGSRIPQSNASWPFVSIPAGSLDGDPNIAPQVNIFTASKAPWCSIDESIPSAPDRGSEEFWAEFMRNRASSNDV